MSFFSKRISSGFRQKVAIVFSLLIIFIMLMSVYLVTIQVKNSSLERAEEMGKLLGRVIALSMGEDIVRGNFSIIEYALNEFAQIERIKYCIILDNHGRVIVSTIPDIQGKYFSDAWSRAKLSSSDIKIRRAGINEQPVYDTSVPIIIADHRYGTIRAGFTLEQEYQGIRSLLFYNLSLGLGLIIVGVLIAYGISSTLLKPVYSIISVIESISQGDYSKKALVSSSDEFEELAKSFNRLTMILEQRETSERNVPNLRIESDSLLRSALNNNSKINAVVMQLRFEKTGNNSMDKRESAESLNKLFEEVSDIITACNGFIEKFSYGYISAFFVAEDEKNVQAFTDSALAAMSVCRNMSVFNFKQAQLKLGSYRLVCALSFGEIIPCRIGSKEYREIVITGSPVECSQRLSEVSSSLESLMIVDSEYYYKAGNNLIFDSVNLGDKKFYTVKQIADAVKKYDMCSRPQPKRMMYLGYGSIDETFEVLRNMVTDKNCKYATEAVQALAPYVFESVLKAVNFLQEQVINSQNPQVRSAAVSVLGWTRRTEFEKVYLAVLNDEHHRVRANALESLIALKADKYIDTFKKLFNDPSSRVRAICLLGLWIAGDVNDTLNSLYNLLKSDDSSMRASGAYALYFISASGSFRRLFPVGNMANSDYLMKPIVENIYKRLLLMLESTDFSERFQSVRAIGKLADDIALKKEINKLIEYETEPEIEKLAEMVLTERML